MSVREEDRRKNSCPSRGLGLAAAAIGVGVGAAMYYFFSKRPENPDSEGSTNQDWRSEEPMALDSLEEWTVGDESHDYTTISVHSTTDTSVHDDSEGFNHSVVLISDSDDNESDDSESDNESNDSESTYEYSDEYGDEYHDIEYGDDEADDNESDHEMERSFEGQQEYSSNMSRLISRAGECTDNLLSAINAVIDSRASLNNMVNSPASFISSIASTSSPVPWRNIAQETFRNAMTMAMSNTPAQSSEISGRSQAQSPNDSTQSIAGEDWDMIDSDFIPTSHLKRLISYFGLSSHSPRLTTQQATQQARRSEAFRQRSWSLEECTICFEIMLKDQPLMTLPCTHNFHVGCIGPWLQEHQTCPICRKAAE